MEEFPPNSKKAVTKPPAEKKKKIERVTSAEVHRRKKGLGHRFRTTFIGGDARTASEYMITNVLIPAARDALVEAISSGFEKLIYGEARGGKRTSRGPAAGPSGYVTYNRMSMQNDDRPPMPKRPSRAARARNDFDDIVLSSRSDAEEVIDRLYDIVNRYGEATVADLYELTGLQSSHTDHKWGWIDLHGSTVTRIRSGGFLLDLPEPEELDS